ncbi:hypothetical protein BLA29_014641, partial [Euroglyphus maynei]
EISVLSLDRIIFYEDGYLTFYNDLDWNFSIKKLMKKNFPDVIIALVALELILIIQKLHECDIIHTNISINNVILFPM